MNCDLVAGKLSNVEHQNLERQVVVQCVAVAVYAFFDRQAYSVQFLVCLLDFQGPVVDRGRSNATAFQALVPPMCYGGSNSKDKRIY